MPEHSQRVILVADDEKKIRDILQDILQHEGYNVEIAGNGEEVLGIVESRTVDLVLMDLVMPGMGGMAALNKLMHRTPGLPVIMVTAHGDIPLAVQATRAGAVDFIEKPVDMKDLLRRISKQLAVAEKKLARVMESDQIYRRFGFIGISSPMQEICALIDQTADTNIRVVITGETGTGKELVARALHRLSSRKDSKFVKVNCAAIPEELIESELFGHKKGSFTGAFADKTGKFGQASGGTLFLDEVADMSGKTQAKVLRAIESGEIQPVGSVDYKRVDVRIVCATNKDLNEMVRNNEFREDLYYRLNVVNIHLPPLSERKEDIPLLAGHYIRYFSDEHNRKRMMLSRQANEFLMQRSWNGNIRELRNLMEKVVVLVDNTVVRTSHLRQMESAEKLETGLSGELTLQQAKEKFEKDYIVNKLVVNNNNASKVARLLGIDRTTLYRKMKQLGIDNQS